MAEQTFAPEWEHNYVLTWSGRWHIADVHAAPERLGFGYDRNNRRTLCGAYGYTRDHVPEGHHELQAIRTGSKQAPTCKKCEKKARA